jgi:ParB family transcriptional regulator, chromosome partitioning protein
MSERRGIGRGLAAILPDAPSAEDELRELPIELIKPNPNQPRRRFDPESMDVLVASINASGLIQPLLVRPLADGS